MLLEDRKDKRMQNVFKLSFALLLSTMIIISQLPAFAVANVRSTGQTFFVAPWGSDQGDGSEKAPWQTIQHGVDSLQAGQILLVRAGTYAESVTIRNMGYDAGGYVTIQAYPGEVPVISGENNKRSSLVQFLGARNVVFDGFTLTNFRVKDSSRSISGIRVLEGSANLVISNNRISDIAHLADKGNANGIVVYGAGKSPITNIQISGNHLHDLVLGSSEALTVVGNVDGFVIENNVIERVNNIGIDVAGFYDTCAIGCMDQARNGIVARNIVSHVDTIMNPAYRGYRAAAGIYVDGGTNTIIEGNEVSYSNYGIEIASEKKGRAATGITVRNNYIHHNQMSGLIMGGAGESRGGATDNLITNNTLYDNNQLRTGDGEITFQYNVQRNTIVNNLLVTNRDTPFIYDNRSSSYGNTLDYNAYHTLDAGQPTWRFAGTRYTDMDAYRKASKQDQNAIISDSMMTVISASDLRPEAESRVVHAGTLQYGQTGELDFYGAARTVAGKIDIGAVQSQTVIEKPIDEESVEPEAPLIDPTEEEGLAGGSSGLLIDGLADDWSDYPALTTAETNVQSIKGRLHEQTLFLLVSGQLLKEKGQLYIRTGNTEHAYFQVPHWSDQQADFLLENGVLYQYSGNGKEWKWVRKQDYRNKQVVIGQSIIEMAIPLADLNRSHAEEIAVGYIWKDSRKDQLPLGGEMLRVDRTGIPVYVEDDGGTVEELPVEVWKPEVDGDLSDWSHFTPLAERTAPSLSFTLYHDKEYLYGAVQAMDGFRKVQLYIDADQQSTTGFQSSRWKYSGAEYLLENAILYRYAGEGKDWNFVKMATLGRSDYVQIENRVEFRIPLAVLGLQGDQLWSVAVMLDDQRTRILPEGEAFVPYFLNLVN